jgi:hypothetical protein
MSLNSPNAVFECMPLGRRRWMKERDSPGTFHPQLPETTFRTHIAGYAPSQVGCILAWVLGKSDPVALA